MRLTVRRISGATKKGVPDGTPWNTKKDLLGQVLFVVEISGIYASALGGQSVSHGAFHKAVEGHLVGGGIGHGLSVQVR